MIDGNDVLVFTGLSMLGAGLWMVSPELMLCVLGVLLAGAGLLGAWKKGEVK